MSFGQEDGGKGDRATWIDDGEKYALVGLKVKVDGHIPSGMIAPYLQVLADTTFNVPPHWQEWLGSIRAREVESCNLFLLSKLPSSTPGILDAENQQLQQRASNFYVGLLLASTFAPAHKPVRLSGSRRDGEIDIRQQHDFDPSIPCIFRPYPPVLATFRRKIGDRGIVAVCAGQSKARRGDRRAQNSIVGRACYGSAACSMARPILMRLSAMTPRPTQRPIPTNPL